MPTRTVKIHWFKNKKAQTRVAKYLAKRGVKVKVGQMAGGWKGRYPAKYYVIEMGKRRRS